MGGKRIRAACRGVLLAMVSISGCATSRSDFVVALPNGHQIVRDKSSAPIIVKKKGGTVVLGPVARYTVIRRSCHRPCYRSEITGMSSARGARRE